MIPGDNLLEDALSIIDSHDFILLKFIGQTTNGIGIDVPSYDDPANLSGSIQAVPRSLFQHLGLDWKKNYIMIYSSDDIVGVDRDNSGDRIQFNSKEFQVLSENDWKPIDGWSGILCVEVPSV